MPPALPMRGLRMEDELYLKLKEIARRETRSYNQQAVHVLTRFVEEYEAKNGPISVCTHDLYE